MTHHFTVEYWIDDDWYVGRLREVPSVISQGETKEELLENLKDAYRLMLKDEHVSVDHPVELMEMEIEM